jgi:hypothetical protein
VTWACAWCLFFRGKSQKSEFISPPLCEFVCRDQTAIQGATDLQQSELCE